MAEGKVPTLSLSIDNGLAADMKQPFLKCRYLVAFVAFSVFLVGSMYRINMTVNIIAMVNQSAMAQQSKVMSNSCPLLFLNSTHTENESEENEDGEFLWSPEVQGYILGSQFLSFILALTLAGRLVDSYGCKWFLFGSFFIAAVGTVLMPVFSWISSEAVIVLQLIRGLGQSFVWPSTSVLIANWFPRSERGQIFTIIMSAMPLGASVGSLLSGFLCASNAKWPSSFYVCGVMGIIASFLVLFFVHESPAVHPRISKAELNYILENQEQKLTKKKPSPPWREMFTSVPVYALFYSSLGIGWGFAQFGSVHSIFLGTILHYPIAKNGLFTALIFFFKFVCMQVAIYLSSVMIRKKIRSINFIRKLWTFLSSFGFSVSILGICFAGCNRSLSVVLAVISICFTGLAFAGSSASVPDMSPNFAGVLQGINSAILLSPSFFLPIVVGFITDGQQTIEQWNKVFYTGIAIVMSSGILYSLFGSADIQPWNSIIEENKEEKTESKSRT